MSYPPPAPEKSHGSGQMLQQPMGQPGMDYQSQVGSQSYPPQHSNKWSFGFWDCCSPFGTFCLACWCPCILFGRTESRMKDPSNHNPETCNGPCAIYCALLSCTGFQCVYQAIRRTDKRDRWGLEGSNFKDWMGACCCPVCGLMQEEKEALLRQQGVDLRQQKGYEKQGQMNYPA